MSDDEYYCIYRESKEGLVPFIFLRYNSDTLSVPDHKLGRGVDLHTKKISFEKYMELIKDIGNDFERGVERKPSLVGIQPFPPLPDPTKILPRELIRWPKR